MKPGGRKRHPARHEVKPSVHTHPQRNNEPDRYRGIVYGTRPFRGLPDDWQKCGNGIKRQTHIGVR